MTTFVLAVLGSWLLAATVLGLVLGRVMAGEPSHHMTPDGSAGRDRSRHAA